MISIALVVVAPWAYLLIAPAAGLTVPWAWIGAGAAGWTLALPLRAPVALGVRRTGASTGTVQRAVILASGPAEEIVRLIVVLIAAADLPTALAIGVGWSAIEAVYAVPQSFARERLASRTDAAAAEARQILADLGMDRKIAPLWGVPERLSASAVHVGFTLLVARWPLIALAAAPLHSGVNVGVLALLRHGIRRMEFALAGAGATILAAGLVVWLAGR